jgi:predicted kinase
VTIMPAGLHLLHGLPGSGKSSYARDLSRRLDAVCFSPDEWMVSRHGNNPPEEKFAGYAAAIRLEIWTRTEALLRRGREVILDSGFWTRAERDEARAKAAALGVECRLYAFRCDEATMLARVLARSAGDPGALQINAAAFRVFQNRFQPLGPDEPHVEVRT